MGLPCVDPFVILSFVDKRWILLLGILLIIVAVGGFFSLKFFSPSSGGLYIETTPVADVFINGEQIGTTPYRGVHATGEVLLRLVPSTSDQPLAPWEVKLSLVSGIETVVKREFGETIYSSAGYVLSFEQIGGTIGEVAVVSRPDGAEVAVDGQILGFTPRKLDGLSIGEHMIVISYPGYLSYEIPKIRTVEGYRLTVDVTLAEDEKVVEENLGPEAIITKTMVEVLDTPVGFLRVREEATVASSEVGRVEPGEKYEFLEETSDEMWYKIVYEEEATGWVSAEYAKKVTETEE